MENLARKEKSFGTANGHDIFTIRVICRAKHLLRHIEALRDYFDRADEREENRDDIIKNDLNDL